MTITNQKDIAFQSNNFLHWQPSITFIFENQSRNHCVIDLEYIYSRIIFLLRLLAVPSGKIAKKTV